MMDNIRPLKTEADYDWALTEIAQYFENEPAVGSSDADRFDVLADLIDAYEARHYPIEMPDPVELIHAHMAMAGFKQAALAKLLGSKPRASEILNRKRAITMDMAFRLHKEWGIPAEVLIRPYHLAAGEQRKKGRNPGA